METPPIARAPFLLSQLGSFAGDRFARLTEAAGMSPREAGVLRLVARTPRINQRELADRLGLPPSRMVALIDSLESRGLVGRARSTTDRRHHELTLTAAGTTAMRALRSIAERHTEDLLAPLAPAEQEELVRLLTKLSDGHRLDREAHVGYSRAAAED
jgi:DNA-binding MarR family transcriptional regulator